ncbi:hypothetical protein PILCRDRAFT_4356 [Piloderma croceum F 1598]|uniref:Alpha N-terminal protein methyltransferase 1 n=1 Tax=Piloderma croceum (strain F 1598) TaxID=765440 RepID=A0A0C3FSG4_PILCF|nr:hypothetical protein PILCRDRAFT_4356 [Piloderma croceum F 1598]
MASSSIPDPVVKDGIEYWNTQPASLDGVLGKSLYPYHPPPQVDATLCKSLPRVDALGSRQFLLGLLPELSTVPSAIRPLSPPQIQHRTRALDVGAGIGRVTSTVLLHLIEDVVLLEPVDSFINGAYSAGMASAKGQGKAGERWKGIQEGTKSVTFLQGTLQSFDPTHPLSSTKLIGRVGYTPQSSPDSDINVPLDVAWCQWCLGHLSDVDLISFLQRCKAALRVGGRSLIVVKENLCRDFGEELDTVVGPRTVFDEQDSSLMRSDLAWKKIFKDAGLILMKEQTQHGLPEGLYEVKMYALR